ncbi:MAG: hypothetical protein M3388_19695 [Acidobacteriota bacterium]|jgi:hypothetical protein|nr:hypothetical protein [Acidobacteriota bacterium]
MSLPPSLLIEMPILQELSATGGSDDVRFLYERLIGYFPQIDESETQEIRNGTNKNWRKSVQKAGRSLDEKYLLKRVNGLWTITNKGHETAQTETSGFALIKADSEELSHVGIQKFLIEIGNSLGFFTEMEFEYYDVVWRETVKSQRISHVFEVQSKGNLDSAFAKLKRAYQSQRSKPFLVLTSERDLNRARKSLAREFQDIETVVEILTFTQIKQIHRNLKPIGEILKKLLES